MTTMTVGPNADSRQPVANIAKMTGRGEKVSLATLSDGGVLLDLESGALLRLNRTAAFVWNRYLAGAQPKDITQAFIEEFGVDPNRAEIDVSSTLRPERLTLSACAVAPDFRYRHTDEICDFSFNGTPVFELSLTGTAIRACVDMNSADLYQCLRAVSPKVLALQGVFVLHASAVQTSNGGIMAFVGESGAGKTTTARAFASIGMRLVCEDKLVLHSSGERIVALLDAEAALESRLVDLHSRIRNSSRERWCDTRSLVSTAERAAVPINRFLMLDRHRRGSAIIETEQLSETDTLIATFVSAFHGSSSSEEWRRQFATAAALARATPAFLTTVPRGVENLAKAATLYRDQVAS